MGARLPRRVADRPADRPRRDPPPPRRRRRAAGRRRPAGRPAHDPGTGLRPRTPGRPGRRRTGPRPATSSAWPGPSALLPRIKARLAERASPLLNELEAQLELCPEIRTGIEQALVDDPPLGLKEGGLIRDGYHPTLDELRELATGGKQWIARYQAEQVKRTGINGLKVGFNKVFGYYIEVTHSQAAGQSPARRLRPQADDQERRAVHHPRAEGVRGQGPPRRGTRPRTRIRAVRHPPRPRRRRGAPARPGRGRAGAGRRALRPRRAGRPAGLLPARAGVGPGPDRSRTAAIRSSTA